MEGEELTEQETAFYDRQIRVWGADAQTRLSKSHVLVGGMNGTMTEFCKNIVLAGVGSLTLVDDRPVDDDALIANFLIHPEENGPAGRSVVEGLINEKCRKSSKRISFYSVECRGSCGEIFVDLQKHTYIKCGDELKKLDETIECQIDYPSFEEAITAPWGSLLKRVSKLHFAMRVFYRNANPRLAPWEITTRPEIVSSCMCYHEGDSWSSEEVIKAISGKGEPLKNFFYDPMDGKCIIEGISCLTAS